MSSEPDPSESPPAVPPRPTPPKPRPARGWLLGLRFVGALASGLLFIHGAFAWLYYPLPIEEHVGLLGAIAGSAAVSFLLWMPFCAWVFYVCMEGRPPTWRSVAAAYLDAFCEGPLWFMELPALMLLRLVRAIRPFGLGLRPRLQELEARLEAGIERRTRGRRNWLHSLVR
ncbi:hypothetical protein BO221_39120 [Archangium sp. Cb G35]|uniref:hypothetical protein n=1 Tax=Archangium sp. Cb G35 TaxID=1920190 RepID=UPI000935DE94|nr:hypothetical protein [Archangium sp. Cb G35]OJT18749.1 hypothetical protein BO221_39120 [Archangium sp. Cb G35]